MSRAARSLLLVGSLALLSVSGARADFEPEKLEPKKVDWQVTLGVAEVHQPEYVGATDTRSFLSPDFTVVYRRLTLYSDSLTYEPVQGKDYAAGFVANLDDGRTDHKPEGPYGVGSDTLRGMGSLSETIEFGVYGGYAIGGWVPVFASVRKAPNGWGHGGTQIDFGFYSETTPIEKLSLTSSLLFTWADAHYMDAYFTVTKAQATASRFREFAASPGVKGYTVNFYPQYELFPQWRIGLGYEFTRLFGSAGRSPVTREQSNTTLALTLSYRI